ncbi:MAG TPA: glycosyltransferase family 2 protein [Candidatus Saccharimonadales bacterium]|nr:glycosyltransferase family 2 protein [Candidatus Saccharimonadales bacterium]
MIDISIVIVNYNTKKFLSETLASLEHEVSKKISFEVVVVDNASSDESAEMVKKEFPDVTLVASRKNVGFAGGNNLGIKKTNESRYVLFLNPDTVIKQGVLEYMTTFMDAHKDAGAATCKLVMANGKIDDATHRGFPTPWNSFTHFSGLSKLFPHAKLFSGYSLGYKDLNTVHEIDALAGAFMIVRREAGEKIGWWDEDYFFYGEDIEFCFRLKENGWKIYYVPDVEIFHHKGVTAGIRKESKDVTTATKERKLFATKHRFKAMKIFYDKHYKNKYPFFVNWMVGGGISLKQWLTLRSI